MSVNIGFLGPILLICWTSDIAVRMAAGTLCFDHVCCWLAGWLAGWLVGGWAGGMVVGLSVRLLVS